MLYTPIKLEKVYEDRVGSDLMLDPMYRPTYNKRIYGEALKDENIGIKKGDRVYFHFNETDRGFTHPENELIHYIKKSRCFVSVRDGEIIPLRGWCLCEPYYGENVTEVQIEGKPMMVREQNGIIVEHDIKPDDRWAYLRHANDHLKPYLGEIVYRAESTNFENTIEGKDFFLMEDDLIMGYRSYNK